MKRLRRSLCIPPIPIRERVRLTKLAVGMSPHLEDIAKMRNHFGEGIDICYLDASKVPHLEIIPRLEKLREVSSKQEVHWMDQRVAEWSHTATHGLTATIVDCRKIADDSTQIEQNVRAAFDGGADYVAVAASGLKNAFKAIDARKTELMAEKKDKRGPDNAVPPSPLILAGLMSPEDICESDLASFASGVILESSMKFDYPIEAEPLCFPIVREINLTSQGPQLSLTDIRAIKDCLGSSACDTLLLKHADEDPQIVLPWVSDVTEAIRFADSESPLLWPKAPSSNVWMNPGEQSRRNPMAEVEVVARAAVAVAGESAASMIVALTRSGNIAHMLSKYRPGVPILVFTDSSHVARRLSMRRGVFALAVEAKDVAALSDYERPAEALRIAKEMEWLQGGDKVVVVTAGEDLDPTLAKESVSMRVVTLSDYEGPIFI